MRCLIVTTGPAYKAVAADLFELDPAQPESFGQLLKDITARTASELFESLTGTSVDAPLCLTCGTKMRPAGSCYVCEGCGSTSGCS